MAGAVPSREQALPLLAAVNNHGDLAVKLSSLRQVKDILLNLEPHHAADLFPYLVELQSSPETLVRKYLLEVIGEIGSNTMEHLSILMPVLITFVRDSNPVLAKQSIIIGTNIFCRVLEELSFQFQRHGNVERWLEELWNWMVKFTDAVLRSIFEAGPVGPKLLAMKFLEICVLQFSLDINDSETYTPEAKDRQGRAFNVSWINDAHPVLRPPTLTSEANRYLGILFDMLRSASNSPGSVIISAINSLAAIARRRPVYYKSVLNTLLDFDSNLETVKGRHAVSIQYSLRTAFLGFLRCSHPIITETRERLVKALRAMNAGDAADQVIRQIDKLMRNNERASRDLRLSKDDPLTNQLHIAGDVTKKRSVPMENEDQKDSFDVTSKRFRYSPHNNATTSVKVNDAGQECVNEISPKLPALDRDLTPVEQMIAMIGALLAEGERGVESLEILVSNIHPDLLADIVITNMKHLPKNLPPSTKNDNMSLSGPSDSSSDPTQAVVSNGFASSTQTFNLAAKVPVSSSDLTTLPLSDISASPNISTDSKRDPRRDPRRLDPRRVVLPLDVPQTTMAEESTNPIQDSAVQSELNAYSSSSPQLQLVPPSRSESIPVLLKPKSESDLNLSVSPVIPEADQPILKDEVQNVEAKELTPDRGTNDALILSPSSVSKVEDIVEPAPIDEAMLDEAYSPSSQESEELLLDISNVEASETASSGLPLLPLYIGLTEDHQRNVKKLALERIINLYQNSQKADFKQTQMALVARLFGQTNVDDVVGMLQKHIMSDYEQQKGHEFVMNILYHLRTLVISDPESSAAAVYDNFLLGLAKSLLDDLPASDKSFSRLLADVPYIPDSVLGLLEDICTERQSGEDGDRVTQGLGAVWSLTLGRPLHRQACLDIALKCAIHSKDDVRAKAIRLVVNKLHAIDHISEKIEQFATDMFLSSVDQRVSDTVLPRSAVSENRVAGQVESQETSISGSQVSEPGSSPNESVNDSSVSFSQAQGLISLFFALCKKKPNLLQLVFDNYARATKAVKQVVHRHIPVLVRALGSSCSELLQIISTPPQGSEQLLVQVLHVLCDGSTPSPDLVAIAKHLYETRLKDANVLVPVLSAFSRDEVLPIFPQLVQLPLDKFQAAMDHILQGSAHAGPALSPAEVLVAIHDISPEREGLPIKKITDACSACFEQRTVFTQSVLLHALNQMVDRTPLPLLFMRTVIQAIDAYPSLVDSVMEILSRLVHRQIWRMPKLWFGFLKCISQTQPHSFRVLLQLPSPQLENALNKYPNLRGPLTAFVNQSGVQASLPRSTLVLLGLSSEPHMEQTHATSSLHSSDPGSSVRGATFT